MERILLVDDKIAVSDFLMDFLALKRYEVYTASDGYAAINTKLSKKLNEVLTI